MADAGTISLNATILPDELSKELFGETYSYTPSATSEGWYYKLTNVTTSSVDLIAGSFLQEGTTSAGTNTGSSPDAVAAGDTVQFLFIKNTGFDTNGTTARTESVYVCFDAGTAAYNLTDAIEISTGQSVGLVLNNTPVSNIHAITAQPKGAGAESNEIQCIVAAIINDE